MPLKKMDWTSDDDVKSNPLEEEKIVERVLSFLPPTEIKRFRLVSKLWSKGGAKQLVKKCFLRTTSCLSKKIVKEEKKLEAIKKFSKFLEFSGSSKHLKLVCERSDCSKMMEIIKELPELRKRTRELKFTGGASSLIKDLAQLMKKLPFVDILYTSTLNLNFSQLDKKNMEKNKNNKNNNDDIVLSEEDSNDDEDLRDIFETFLGTLKDLDKLYLNTFIRTDVELGDYLTHRKNLTALKSLSLITVSGTVDNIPRERTFLSSSCQEWKLTHLTWKLCRKISKGQVHSFILNFASSLEQLSITIEKEQDDATPWTDDWYIPYNLTKLKVLEIAGASDHVRSGIFTALQINNLEKLVVKNPPHYVDTYSWKNHRLANGRTLCSETITQVEFDKVECHNEEFLRGTFWPNVKSVKVDKLVLSASWMRRQPPFLNSQNIEHLEFDLTDVSSKNFQFYEVWMAGGNCKNLYDPENPVTRKVDDDSFRLRDLDSLKSLTIRGAGFIGDFLFYNCFQHLTSLQSLHLQGARVSQKALNDLKERLFHSASIIITN